MIAVLGCPRTSRKEISELWTKWINVKWKITDTRERLWKLRRSPRPRSTEVVERHQRFRVALVSETCDSRHEARARD